MKSALIVVNDVCHADPVRGSSERNIMSRKYPSTFRSWSGVPSCSTLDDGFGLHDRRRRDEDPGDVVDD
jgi:hypothetical protein